MIIIRLKGGMGNQMFQYAFGRSLAEKLDCPLKLDLTALLDRSKKDFVHRDYDLHIFNTQASFLFPPGVLRNLYWIESSRVTRWMKGRATAGRKLCKEPHFHFSEDILNHPSTNTVYEGWWQSERYFAPISDLIREEFSFKQPLLFASRSLLDQIADSQSVCLNVRRTDFLKVPTLNTTNKDYFYRAADHLAERIKDPVFFVFSDDMSWCEKNLKLPYPTVFVQHDMKGEKFGNYHRLMRACKHFIIPNSSFAWWAVWLNEHAEKLVVAPKNWFNDSTINTEDLVPESWIRL